MLGTLLLVLLVLWALGFFTGNAFGGLIHLLLVVAVVVVLFRLLTGEEQPAAHPVAAVHLLLGADYFFELSDQHLAP
jgi:hypothetical protein